MALKSGGPYTLGPTLVESEGFRRQGGPHSIAATERNGGPIAADRNICVPLTGGRVWWGRHVCFEAIVLAVEVELIIKTQDRNIETLHGLHATATRAAS